METRESTTWGWVHKEHVLMVMLAVLVLQVSTLLEMDVPSCYVLPEMILI